MRRGLASLITGLSLLVATVSWAGFTLSRTILDPGRSERLAEQLLDNPQVQEALVTRLADAVEPQIPPEAPVSRSLIEAGAETALADPRVRALLVDGMVQYHRNALEGTTDPVVVEAGALGLASRDALVGVRPELDPFLPAAPAVQLELPTTGFTWLASVKRFVDRWTLVGGLVAVAGATLALVVARDRGAVFRRVAFWGYGAAAFWLIVGFALPRLADVLSPTSGAIAAAAVDVFFGAMIRPAVVLAIASTALLLTGFALPAVGRRRGALVLQPPRPVAGDPRRHQPGSDAVPAPGPAGTTGSPASRPGPVPLPPPVGPATATPGPGRPIVFQATPAPAATTPAPRPSPAPQPPAPPRADATAAFPRPQSDPSPGAPGPGPAPQPSIPGGETAAWEEGVGYLDESPSGPSAAGGRPGA